MCAIIVFVLSVLLWAGLFASAAELPDPDLTPGVVRDDLTLEQICKTKWGRDARAVTAAMKKQVFTSYGIKCRPLFGKSRALQACGNFEIDHLVSRELGGKDDVRNLWPQKYKGPWNARLKDRTENRLHVEMCKGNITLEDAQDEIRTDWRKPYIRYFGQP
jgi:hypothetical protein